MSNVNRTLTNLCKDRLTATALEAIEKRDGLFDATSVIPNQAFPTQINDLNQPSCVFFSEEATTTLDFLKRVAHKLAVTRDKMKKPGTQIEFVCYGYRDHDNDIVIYDIDCPYVDEFVDEKRGVVDIAKMAKSTPDRKNRTDTTYKMYDFVYRNSFSENPIGRELVPFLGLIRPEDTVGEKKHAPTLREISDIVVPGDVKFPADFSTGLLIIPPSDIQRTKDGLERVDASMECMVIDHTRTPSGNAKPNSIANLTMCEMITANGNKKMPMSQNRQNLEGLPTLPVKKSPVRSM
ncbi:MAG: hypothetical protein E7354_01965 [Clostridiales bacterium]|nr:hypothetical protein [Clostridiales bacterium]